MRNRRVGGLSTNLTGGSVTLEKLHGLNGIIATVAGGAAWNYNRARSCQRIDDEGGAKPQKRRFDSWNEEKKRVVRFTFVNRVAANDSRSMCLHRFNLPHRRIMKFPLMKAARLRLLHVLFSENVRNYEINYEKFYIRTNGEKTLDISTRANFPLGSTVRILFRRSLSLRRSEAGKLS